MALSSELREALARSRGRPRSRGRDDDSHNALLRADPDAGRHDTVPTDDSIDLDDSGSICY